MFTFLEMGSLLRIDPGQNPTQATAYLPLVTILGQNNRVPSALFPNDDLTNNLNLKISVSLRVI